MGQTYRQGWPWNKGGMRERGDRDRQNVLSTEPVIYYRTAWRVGEDGIGKGVNNWPGIRAETDKMNGPGG